MLGARGGSGGRGGGGGEVGHSMHLGGERGECRERGRCRERGGGGGGDCNLGARRGRVAARRTTRTGHMCILSTNRKVVSMHGERPVNVDPLSHVQLFVSELASMVGCHCD